MQKHRNRYETLQSAIIKRAIGESEFNKLVHKYESAKLKRTYEPTDKEISMAIEYRKSNLTTGEFAKRKGMSYWKMDTILNRVARHRFLNEIK